MKKKIVFVAMPSIHFIRWVSNLNTDEYELYWFDVLDRGYCEELNFLTQITDWKTRKIKPIKGEYFLSKKLPNFYARLQPLLEVTIHQKFAEILNSLKPDLVHSFEMQSCSYPLIDALKIEKDIKWLYSCWGNDLYYYRNVKKHIPRIRTVLERVDYLHTDCERDYKLAREIGFEGCHAGVIPGGAGYDLQTIKNYYRPIEERNVILIKGYEHTFGRAINILKALIAKEDILTSYKIIVFSAHTAVVEFLGQTEHNLDIAIYPKTKNLPHKEIIKLMGRSILYIGNSISDGMPNTLLEALCLGVFPIQSNPGGATEEVISHKKNGLLISNPNDVTEIASQIEYAINNKELVLKAHHFNKKYSESNLDHRLIQKKIMTIYANSMKN